MCYAVILLHSCSRLLVCYSSPKSIHTRPAADSCVFTCYVATSCVYVLFGVRC